MTALFAVPAFSQAYESHITYGKKKQKAISIDYTYPQEAVQNAIVQKIEKFNLRIICLPFLFVSYTLIFVGLYLFEPLQPLTFAYV